MSLRFLIVGVLTLLACSDRKARGIVRRSPLETGIARDLTARFSTSVTTQCTVIAGIPAKCEATLADGTKLPIVIKAEGNEWAWHIDGIVVEVGPIEAYVTASLADLRVAQQATCGARIQLVRPGDRINCALSAGGMAFVRIASDGATSLELALDAASAAARGEPVTPERDLELARMSRALEGLEGESDGEDKVPSDGGVPSP